MAKLPIDLKHFKKISEDKQYTTLEHKHGHQMKIAHSALAPEMQKQLQSLPMNKGRELSSNPKSDVKKSVPHLAKGGVAVEEDNGNDIAPISDKEAYAPMPSNQAAAAVVPEQVQATPAAPQGQMPQQEVSPEPQAGQAPNQPAMPAQQEMAPQLHPQLDSDPYGANTESAAALTGLRSKESAIPYEVAGAQAQAQAEAEAYRRAADDMQMLNNHHQHEYSKLNNERLGFVHDVDKLHVDPERYMNNRSTGAKIGNAIGLLLGGMSAGTLGGPNPAVVAINNHIERDIDAQKAEIGKKESLLNANLRQFGNMRDASDMTRIMINDTVANRIKQAAQSAGASNPRIAAAALNAIGGLEYDSAQRQGNLAMRRTILNAGQPGGAQVKIRPEMKIKAIIPEGEQAAYMKELAEAQDTAKARDNLLSAAAQLDKINTAKHRIFDPIQTPKQVAAIAGPVIEQLAKDKEGRVTPTTVNYLMGLMPSPLDTGETPRIKRQRLQLFIDQKMNYPKLKSIGIDVNDFGGYDNQGNPHFTKLPPNIKK